ncbi:MAG: beta-glucuronidase [Candidatus Avispirillum sp.]
MAERIRLDPDSIRKIRTVDERLVSYNIEMTEVTGGTFWKAYTPAQVEGTERFEFSGKIGDFTAMTELMQYFPPIDLYSEKLRNAARALGSAWIRVSGSWATKTYYDFEDTTGGKPPKGYASVLTRSQWTGVLDFVKAVGGKLLISVSNCEGDHPDGGPLDLTQAKKIFGFSHDYGVDIDAAEFMNEPNMLEISGAPKGYTSSDYVRDQDIFNSWVRENYPDCLVVGPCNTDSIGSKTADRLLEAMSGKKGSIGFCLADGLMAGAKVPLDVFSYHCYNGISERGEAMVPEAHWDGSAAHTEAYLAVAPDTAKRQMALRDKYAPGAPMWVTESGDAGGGGNTWASTYLDVFRTLNELGSFSRLTDGVIFHNTLASSDYGFLQHGSFDARPNYFAVLLWNRLMGTAVYDCSDPGREGAHIYCHSRRDGKDGAAYLVINNSLSDTLTAELVRDAQIYTLSAGSLRSPVMRLNGKELRLNEDGSLPDMSPVPVSAGTAEFLPASCTFIVM